MKKIAWVILLLAFSRSAYSQDNLIAVEGGYAFALIENSQDQLTGWRINGLYEYAMPGHSVMHGLSLGYVSLSGTSNGNLVKTTSDNWSVPIYYAPKLCVGSETVKGFIKAAAGFQFSGVRKTSNSVVAEVSDHGFLFGGGAGVFWQLSESYFVKAEYELLWLANSYYRDGGLNTASLGVGMRF